MDIVLATRNRKKVEELGRMFAGTSIRIRSLADFAGCPEVEEDGKTFRANALKKARAVSRFTGLPALADDSGLEVFTLAGEPGVYSARYAGPDADDRNNVDKLLKSMKKIPTDERQAQFVCCMALALPDGHTKTFTGHARGVIGKKPKGFNGFGYDPVFLPEGHNRTFAEMSDAEKDALSHRGKAMKKIHDYLIREII